MVSVSFGGWFFWDTFAALQCKLLGFARFSLQLFSDSLCYFFFLVFCFLLWRFRFVFLHPPAAAWSLFISCSPPLHTLRHLFECVKFSYLDSFFYYFFLSFWVWLTGIWLWQFQSLHSSCSPFSGNFDSFVKSFYCDLLQSCKSNAAKRKRCEQREGGGQLEFPIDISARDLERMLRINY